MGATKKNETVKELINHLPNWMTFLAEQKKKDDLCDAFLQGAYYFEKNL